MRDETFCLLFSVDDAFATQLGVCLQSIIASNPRHRFAVYVATTGCCEAVTRVVEHFAKRHPAMETRIVAIDAARFARMPQSGRFSQAACCRIFWDEIVDARHETVLYLDADIVVREDLSRLFGISLDGKACGAVRDFLRLDPQQIDFAPDEPYFNSGVLLLHRANWIAGGYARALLACLEDESQGLTWADQDAINLVLRGKIKELPLQWNFQPRYADVPSWFLGLAPDAYRAIRRDPAIVHYTTSLKPWSVPDAIHYSDFFRRSAAAAGYAKVVPMRRPFSMTAAKTALRWRFPGLFRLLRSAVFPKRARMMYRSSATGS